MIDWYYSRIQCHSYFLIILWNLVCWKSLRILFFFSTIFKFHDDYYSMDLMLLIVLGTQQSVSILIHVLQLWNTVFISLMIISPLFSLFSFSELVLYFFICPFWHTSHVPFAFMRGDFHSLSYDFFKIFHYHVFNFHMVHFVL